MKHSISPRNAVQLYKLDGYSQERVARLLKKSRSFVERWWNRDSVLRKSGSQRPIKITPVVSRRVLMRIQHRPRLSQRQLAAMEGVSPRSIRRVFKQQRLRPYRLRQTLFMSDQHRKNRVSFARRHRNDDWGRTFFVDEKTFVITPKSNRQNTRYYAISSKEVPFDIKDTHSKKLNVAAGMASTGTTQLFIFHDNMTAETYKSFLSTTLLPKARKLFGNDWRLAQDNDRKHTSKLVTAFLAEKQVEVVDWPAKSPDINPIENLWSILDSKVPRDPRMSLDALEKNLKKEWKKISPELLQKLVSSVPARLEAVIESKGQTISY